MALKLPRFMRAGEVASDFDPADVLANGSGRLRNSSGDRQGTEGLFSFSCR